MFTLNYSQIIRKIFTFIKKGFLFLKEISLFINASVIAVIIILSLYYNHEKLFQAIKEGDIRIGAGFSVGSDDTSVDTNVPIEPDVKRPDEEVLPNVKANDPLQEKKN